MTNLRPTDRLAPDVDCCAVGEVTLPSRKLSVKEAAAYLGLSMSMLNKLRLSGDGPQYIKARRRVLYDIRDLEAWLARRKRSHTSEPS